MGEKENLQAKEEVDNKGVETLSVSKRVNMSALIGLAFLGLASSSYVPPYYEGTATLASVVSLDPPDFRGEDVYRIEFNLNAKAGMPQVPASLPSSSPRCSPRLRMARMWAE